VINLLFSLIMILARFDRFYLEVLLSYRKKKRYRNENL